MSHVSHHLISTIRDSWLARHWRALMSEQRITDTYYMMIRMSVQSINTAKKTLRVTHQVEKNTLKYSSNSTAGIAKDSVEHILPSPRETSYSSGIVLHSTPDRSSGEPLMQMLENDPRTVLDSLAIFFALAECESSIKKISLRAFAANLCHHQGWMTDDFFYYL